MLFIVHYSFQPINGCNYSFILQISDGRKGGSWNKTLRAMLLASPNTSAWRKKKQRDNIADGVQAHSRKPFSKGWTSWLFATPLAPRKDVRERSGVGEEVRKGEAPLYERVSWAFHKDATSDSPTFPGQGGFGECKGCHATQVCGAMHDVICWILNDCVIFSELVQFSNVFLVCVCVVKF